MAEEKNPTSLSEKRKMLGANEKCDGIGTRACLTHICGRIRNIEDAACVVDWMDVLKTLRDLSMH